MVTNSIDSLTNRQVFENSVLKIGAGMVVLENQGNVLNQKNKFPVEKIEEKYRKEIEETIKDINGIVKKVREGLKFKLHEETEILMVQIIDIETMEVIKELPPEEMLDLSARIQEMVGIFIDEKV